MVVPKSTQDDIIYDEARQVDTKFDNIMLAKESRARSPWGVDSINLCLSPTHVFFGMLWQIVRMFMSK